MALNLSPRRHVGCCLSRTPALILVQSYICTSVHPAPSLHSGDRTSASLFRLTGRNPLRPVPPRRAAPHTLIHSAAPLDSNIFIRHRLPLIMPPPALASPHSLPSHLHIPFVDPASPAVTVGVSHPYRRLALMQWVAVRRVAMRRQRAHAEGHPAGA